MRLQGRQDIQLYYGTRNGEATAYSDLDDNWKSVGVETVHVYSDDNKGYVQDVLSQVIRMPSCHCRHYRQNKSLVLACSLTALACSCQLLHCLLVYNR